MMIFLLLKEYLHFKKKSLIFDDRRPVKNVHFS